LFAFVSWKASAHFGEGDLLDGAAWPHDSAKRGGREAARAWAFARGGTPSRRAPEHGSARRPLRIEITDGHRLALSCSETDPKTLSFRRADAYGWKADRLTHNLRCDRSRSL
jgi:hypothetical protein